MDYKKETVPQRNNDGLDVDQQIEYQNLYLACSESIFPVHIDSIITWLESLDNLPVETLNDSHFGALCSHWFDISLENFLYFRIINLLNELCQLLFDSRDLVVPSLFESLYFHLINPECQDIYHLIINFLTNLVHDDMHAAELICESLLYQIFLEQAQNSLFFPIFFNIAALLPNSTSLIYPLVQSPDVSARLTVEFPNSPYAMTYISQNPRTAENIESPRMPLLNFQLDLSTLNYLVKAHDLETIENLNIKEIFQSILSSPEPDHNLLNDFLDLTETLVHIDINTSFIIEMIEGGIVKFFCDLEPAYLREISVLTLSGIILNCPTEYFEQIIHDGVIRTILEIVCDVDPVIATEALRAVAYLGLISDKNELKNLIKNELEENGGLEGLQDIYNNIDDDNKSFAQRCIQLCQHLF